MKLETARLLLKPPAEEDVGSIVAVASDWRIAEMTLVPHPYCADDAREWIKRAGSNWQEYGMGGFSIFTRHGLAFIGAIGIRPTGLPGHASTGYWLCPSVWGRGFATEALREILRFGFEVKNLDRIEAEHLVTNPSSGRVMEKVGMGHAVKVDLDDRDGRGFVPGIRRHIHVEEWISSRSQLAIR